MNQAVLCVCRVRLHGFSQVNVQKMAKQKILDVQQTHHNLYSKHTTIPNKNSLRSKLSLPGSVGWCCVARQQCEGCILCVEN